jgi:DNA-binding SARP family transcriptional activator/tetratricopeptide (TPR) repeat protein
MIFLHTLGTLELGGVDEQARSAVHAQPKRLALLTYLAAAQPTGFHRRDRLLALFWPELDTTRARDALNQAIRFLRRSLGSEVIVSRGAEEIGVASELLWCDAVAFRALLDRDELEKAVSLYKGEFLVGVYVSDAREIEEWIEAERTTLRLRAARAARMLADRFERERDTSAAVAFARQAAELAGADERIQRELIGLLDRLGDRAGALGAYQALSRRMAQEFETTPAPETEQLIATIRSRASARGNAVLSQPNGDSEGKVLEHESSPVADPRTAVSPGVGGSAATSRSRVFSRRTVAGSLVTLGIAFGGFGISHLREVGLFPLRSLHAAGVLSATDTILVADFSSPAGDTTLGPTVGEAFRIELLNSGAAAMPAERAVQYALQSIGWRKNTTVDPFTARVVALQMGLKAMVVGDVNRVGSTYSIAVKLVSPRDSTVLYEDYALAQGSDRILDPALTHLARRFRAKMGEPLRSVASTPEGGFATTRSIEALKLLIDGVRYRITDPWDPRALEAFEQAVALDSSFVEAYRRIATTLDEPTIYDDGRSRRWWAIQHAFDLRASVDEYRRRVVEGTYYAAGPYRDLAKSIPAYERALELKPRSSIATNNLGQAYRSLRDFARADFYLRLCDSLGRGVGLTLSNWAHAKAALGDTARARELLDHARRIGNPQHDHWFGFYFAAERIDSARAQALALVVSPSFPSTARARPVVMLAQAAAVRGHLREADSLYGQAEWIDSSLGHHVAAARHALRREQLRATYSTADRKRCAAADDILRRYPQAKSPLDGTLLDVARLCATAGDQAAARSALGMYEQAMRPYSDQIDVLQRHAVAAEIALAAGNLLEGVRQARLTNGDDCVPCSLIVLARVFDAAGMRDSALTYYGSYLKSTFTEGDRVPYDELYRARAHERLADLLRDRGELPGAISQLERFVQLWNDADAELQPEVARARSSLRDLRMRLRH